MPPTPSERISERERTLLLALRRALLFICAAIEKVYGKADPD